MKQIWGAILTVALAAPAWAAEPGGRELVAHVERLLWGKTNQGLAEMTVVTPRWTRTLGLRFWMERPERTFTSASSRRPRRPASARCASGRKCGITCPRSSAPSRSRPR